jgi:hypothetical protein
MKAEQMTIGASSRGGAIDAAIKALLRLYKGSVKAL